MIDQEAYFDSYRRLQDALLARYELDMDFGTIPVLAERHGLRLG